MKQKQRIIRFTLALAAMVIIAAMGLFSTKVYAADDTKTAFNKIVVTTKDGNGNTIEKADGYQKASFVFTAADGTVLEQTGKIKVRGNSTSKAEKKPFNIKLDSKEDIFGMGKGKKWCLLANCFDPTLLRNYLAFNFAAELGLSFTSESRFIELYVDGVFKGCYLITEPVETGKTRIDIDPEATDAFLIEYESYRDEDLVAYITADEDTLRWAISEPEMPDPSDYDNKEKDEQYIADKAAYDKRVEEISAIINNIVEILKKGDITEIRKVIDLESFAAYYVLNEFFKTCDFNWSSVYFYYQNGKLYAGPAWDYDLSTGNMNPEYPSLIDYDNNEEEREYVTKYSNFYFGGEPEYVFASYCNIYFYLCQNEDFMKRVGKLYESKQDYIKNLYAEAGMIDTLCKDYAELFEENFTGIEAGGAGWDVSKAYADTMRVPDATYEENVKFLSDWLSARNEWLSTELTVKPVIVGNPQDMTVLAGKYAKFSVDAKGYDLKYQWQYRKPGAKKWRNVKDATESYFYPEASKKKSGIQYRCIVKNSEGKAVSEPAVMTVLKKSELKTKLVGYTVDVKNNTITFNYKLSKDVLADENAFLCIGKDDFTGNITIDAEIPVSEAVKTGKGKNAVYSFTHSTTGLFTNYFYFQLATDADYSPVYTTLSYIN